MSSQTARGGAGCIPQGAYEGLVTKSLRCLLSSSLPSGTPPQCSRCRVPSAVGLGHDSATPGPRELPAAPALPPSCCPPESFLESGAGDSGLWLPPAESFATSPRLIRTRPCRPIGVCSGAAPRGEVQVLRSPASILEHQIYPFYLSKGIGFGNSKARKRTPWGAGSGRLWTLQVSRPSPFPSTAPSGLRVTAVVRAAQVLEMVAQETSGGFNSSAGEKPGGEGVGGGNVTSGVQSRARQSPP